jgi:hypothetical protein
MGGFWSLGEGDCRSGHDPDVLMIGFIQSAEIELF